MPWCFLTLFSPLIALPIIVWGIHVGARRSVVALVVLMGLISMTIPPIGDQSRFFLWMEMCETGTLSQILENATPHEMNLVYFIAAIFAKLGFSLEWLRFCLIVLSYSVVLSPLVNSQSKLPSAMFWPLFFSVPFAWICFGMRNGFAAALAASAFYYYVQEKKKSIAYVLFCLSGLTHVSLVPMCSIIVLGSKIIGVNKRLLLICICLSFMSSSVLTWIGSAFASHCELVDAYLNPSSYWATGFLEDRGMKYIVLCYLYASPAFVWVLIRNAIIKSELKFDAVANGAVLLSVFVMPFPNIWYRSNFLVLIIISYDIVVHMVHSQSCRKVRHVMLLLMAMVFFGMIYENRQLLDKSVQVHFWLSPLVMNLNRHYSTEYFESMITDDGNYFIGSEPL